VKPVPSGRRGITEARGFTLIEVLVALAFLVLAIVALLGQTGSYTANAGVLREKTLALWVAHNRLTEIGLEPGWPAVGRSDGDAQLAEVDWRWDVTVSETPDPRVRRVDITVRREAQDDPAAELSSFVAERAP
jgi:general secretion pathway protein I